MTNINTDGFFSPGQSIAEDRDNPGLSESGSNTLTTNNQHVTNNDEELSISENTISSDKPVNLISRNARKKVTHRPFLFQLYTTLLNLNIYLFI